MYMPEIPTQSRFREADFYPWRRTDPPMPPVVTDPPFVGAQPNFHNKKDSGVFFSGAFFRPAYGAPQQYDGANADG